jgi:chromosome segregation ATPase
MYREYWELRGRYELAQIYDEARYDVRGLLRLHKIVKDLGMGEKEIIKVLELAKYDELQNLQWKVECLRNEVNMLENEKWKSTNQILKLNRMIDEFQSSLAQKRGEMANMNQESGWYDNTSKLYPVPYSEPDTSSYSIRLSYSDY